MFDARGCDDLLGKFVVAPNQAEEWSQAYIKRLQLRLGVELSVVRQLLQIEGAGARARDSWYWRKQNH